MPKQYRYECAVCGESFRTLASADKHTENHGHTDLPPMKRTTVQDMRSTLRQRWLRSPERAAALNLAKTKVVTEEGLRTRYRCSGCGEAFRLTQVDVDHLEPVGSLDPARFAEDFGSWTLRMFIDAKGLRVLCKSCHRLVTRGDGPRGGGVL